MAGSHRDHSSRPQHRVKPGQSRSFGHLTLARTLERDASLRELIANRQGMAYTVWRARMAEKPVCD